MTRLVQQLLSLSLLSGAVLPLLAATPEEKNDFEAAESAFHGAAWERAERQFAKFVQTYTNSVDLPKAILYQAEARHQRGNYAGAIELLNAHLAQAGNLAGEYVFWIAEAQFHKGDTRAAAEGFMRMRKEFPDSPRALEASVEEAAARSQLNQWPEVIALLGQTNGVFQSAARTNSANAHVVEGYFLLSKACLVTGNYLTAEKALEPLANLSLDPGNDWQRQYLMCKIQLADGRTDEALRNSTNLLALAAKAGQAALQAESISFQGGLFERLGQRKEAIAAYKQNLEPTTPTELQAQALVKIAQLYLAQDRLAEAAETFEKFLQMTNAPNADLAWLTLGELRLRQHLEDISTNNVGNAATNAPVAPSYLEQALGALNTFVTDFPKSPRLGRGELDLGWCYWLKGTRTNGEAAFQAMKNSQKAFQSAVEHLPPPIDEASSLDLATAYFKLADTQFQQTNYLGALTNYSVVVEKFGAQEQIKTNLLEPALYQQVRAAQKAGRPAVASEGVRKILAWFPNGFYTDRAVLLNGQEEGRKNFVRAREIYSEFLKQTPDPPLRAELELAIARTYEQQGLWTKAIEQYDDWVATFTNHSALASAEYYRARANLLAGRETNALAGFTNFVAQYPTNELTQWALWSIASFYYEAGKWEEAEQNYKNLYQGKPPSKLAYQARMMAGRSAFALYHWKDATNHFAALADETNCPPDLTPQAMTDLRVQAMFAYGDTLMNMDSESNKLGNLQAAAAYFRAIEENYPTNRLAPMAWGEMANCALQMHQYDLATKAFQKVIDSPLADIVARSAAKIGLATVLRKQAEEESGEEQATLLRQALDRCLDVFYPQNILREGETADPFWTSKAGLEAASLAETLREWDQAIGINRELAKLLPSMKEKFEKNIQKCQEQNARSKEQNISLNHASPAQ